MDFGYIYDDIFKYDYMIRLHNRRNEVLKKQTNGKNICYDVLDSDVVYRKLSMYNKQHLHYTPIKNEEELLHHVNCLEIGEKWINERLENVISINDIEELHTTIIEHDKQVYDEEEENNDKQIYEEDNDEVPPM